MRLILPLKFRKESSNQARPPLKLCENDFNTKAVVLIENGADVCLVDNESKERFFTEVIQAGVEWNFHDRLGRHMDLHYQQIWDIPGICMNALAIGLTIRYWLFSRTFNLEPNKIPLLETQLCI
ncbi:MAG: hypothetical protein VW492_14935 [Deltaproteobacteria bacterium]